MSDKVSKILLVEDEAPLAALYSQYLKEENVSITHVSTGAAAKEVLYNDPPDAMLLDVRLPDMEGTELLNVIRLRNLSTSVIMITAHGSINMAVETMRGGAYDFLVKPFNRQRLVDTLKNALQREVIRREVVQETRKIPNPSTKGFHGFVGQSKPMQMVYNMIENASSSRATVFITGESGTGKEVCAESIHRLSPRAKKPLVILNCAAIPKDLMESEIFGHVKGAFTGAITDHEGAAAQADGGTLFLDEICEMDMHLQSKLLRFIQTGTFQKVGSAKTQTVDIRFVCATNKDPLTEIGAGRFREDLYYRLHVVPMHMPPLRERGDDILMIARKFLVEYANEEGKAFSNFDEGASQVISTYQWPGNVRQLQNVIRNAVVLNKGELITTEMLPPPLNGKQEQSGDLARPRFGAVAQARAPLGAIPNQPPHGSAGAVLHYRDVSDHSAAPIANGALGANGSNGTNGSMGYSDRPAGFSAPTPGGLPSAQTSPAAAAVQDLVGHGYSVPTRDTAPANGHEPTSNAASAAPADDPIIPLWETEKRAIEQAIDNCNGNIPKAAALLGISASTIYRTKQQWESNGV